jgi:hypothetical protein
MDIRRRTLPVVALVVLSVMAVPGMASAKNAVGSKKWCAAHPVLARSTASCRTAGGGSGSGTGTGGSPAPLTVQIDPDPLVETGQSYVVATIQVETSPSFAGDAVNIDSSQLTAACDGSIDFFNLQNGGTPTFPNNPVLPNIQAILDDDGNAMVLVVGYGCAPGSSVVEADLTSAPYYTALGTLTAEPPVVTPSGVSGYPTTSGTVTSGEVETGDTTASGDSDVYGVFYVETSPVYAEESVEITSPELENRCGTGWSWITITPTGGVVAPPTSAQATLDDDGNAVFVFLGSSCAAGSSEVIADVEAGSHPTYTTTFSIVAPQPTI